MGERILGDCLQGARGFRSTYELEYLASKVGWRAVVIVWVGQGRAEGN